MEISYKIVRFVDRLWIKQTSLLPQYLRNQLPVARPVVEINVNDLLPGA